jgi:hypothetical protein
VEAICFYDGLSFVLSAKKPFMGKKLVRIRANGATFLIEHYQRSGSVLTSKAPSKLAFSVSPW